MVCLSDLLGSEFGMLERGRGEYECPWLGLSSPSCGWTGLTCQTLFFS